MAVKDKKARFNPFVPPTHFQQQVGWGTRLANEGLPRIVIIVIIIRLVITITIIVIIIANSSVLAARLRRPANENSHASDDQKPASDTLTTAY